MSEQTKKYESVLVGWADEPKKRKEPKKGARMRAKLSLKKATDEQT